MSTQTLIRCLFLTLLLSISGAGTASAQTADPAPAEPTQLTQVDLNLATPAQLESLPGIGPSKAEAIVTHRQARPFQRIQDIMRVRGIGRSTFRAIRDRLTVTPAPARTRGGSR